jgi:hypothetical protein
MTPWWLLAAPAALLLRRLRRRRRRRVSVLGVIPARWASTRFPGKPLALIDGKPMIQARAARLGPAGVAAAR